MFLPSYVLYLRYASPFARVGASLLFLRLAPPLIGCRLLLSLSPSLSPPPLHSSRPPASSRLLLPHLPYPCSPLRYSASATFTLLPSTCRLWLLIPFLTSSLPCFDLSSPSPSLYPPLLSLQLPSLVTFFLLWVRLVLGLGVGIPSAFGGPLYPFYYLRLSHQPIMRCSLLPLASAFLYIHPHAWVTSLVFFMSFSHCAFFYSSFFFSLDSPSLPFVFGAAHLYFFVRCGGVVRCLLGLFLALLLFPTSIRFLGLCLFLRGFSSAISYASSSCYVPWLGMGCL